MLIRACCMFCLGYIRIGSGILFLVGIPWWSNHRIAHIHPSRTSLNSMRQTWPLIFSKGSYTLRFRLVSVSRGEFLPIPVPVYIYWNRFLRVHVVCGYTDVCYWRTRVDACFAIICFMWSCDLADCCVFLRMWSGLMPGNRERLVLPKPASAQCSLLCVPGPVLTSLTLKPEFSQKQPVRASSSTFDLIPLVHTWYCCPQYYASWPRVQVLRFLHLAILLIAI